MHRRGDRSSPENQCAGTRLRLRRTASASTKRRYTGYGVSCCSRRMWMRSRLRSASARRSRSPANSMPGCGSCGPRQVNAGCGSDRAMEGEPASDWPRSTAGSVKASTRPICSRRRRYSRSWGSHPDPSLPGVCRSSSPHNATVLSRLQFEDRSHTGLAPGQTGRHGAHRLPLGVQLRCHSFSPPTEPGKRPCEPVDYFVATLREM
jgi:hypothetical protein